jgi:hypothetical protein
LLVSKMKCTLYLFIILSAFIASAQEASRFQHISIDAIKVALQLHPELRDKPLAYVCKYAWERRDWLTNAPYPPQKKVKVWRELQPRSSEVFHRQQRTVILSGRFDGPGHESIKGLAKLREFGHQCAHHSHIFLKRLGGV